MGKLIKKGISPIIAGLVLAIVVAGALGFYLYWARTQASRLPMKPPESCPAVVMDVANSSMHSVFVVFAGDMSNDYIYIIVLNTSSTGAPLPPQAVVSSPINAYFNQLSPQDIAKLTSSPTGFDMIFSGALPTSSSYTLNNLTFAYVTQTPWYSQLQQNNYYAFQFTFTASPKKSAVYSFRLQAVGAYEILVIDAVRGYVINRTGYYTSNTADLKQANALVTLNVPMYTGNIYTIIVRQVIWYQQVVDRQTPYLWLDIGSYTASQPLAGYQPATYTTLSNYFTSYKTDIIAVPGDVKGSSRALQVNGLPLYWVCRGYIAPVQR
jgi:hypothetical protein